MNKKSTQVIIAIIVAIVFFIGGLEYGKSTATATTASSTRSATGSTFAGGTGARSFAGRGAAGGGFVGGKIVSVDPTSISIALPNSTSTSVTTGSTVVLYSTGTSILKSIVGSSADLEVGDSVTVTGTSNSDGSMSATSIQIRPTMAQNQ